MTLQISNLSKVFRGPDGIVQAADHVSLDVGVGGFTALMGPSGSGKSTVLLSSGGLLVPDDGTVLVAGEDIYAATQEKRARIRASTIGFVFQQFHLIPYLNVLDNVLTPALALKIPDAAARAQELVSHFGLDGRVHHVPSELSTGEKQRAALARALLHRPKLLLADEPTGNLDEENSERVLKALREFANGGGAVLLVTHFANAAGYADTVVRLEDGKLFEA
jgi:ABC-type lipoprotein export system ATPase subunit